ncbi:MAG: asparagine synthase (glutamine-hydrolyzing) [Verrucomicrobiales bacterium]|nr:asparagine synthase (glutamine-hydrolyzing) [Verrucomicrobiales bacterium]
MSAIAGILIRNGSPPPSPILSQMLEVVAHRGPDGRGQWTDRVVALGHLSLVTVPEAENERQPLHDEQAKLSITFDGRIDNRDELLTILKGQARLSSGMSDAQITLKAYQHWGENCANHLLGDFAFAIWDSRKQQLFLARDIKGVKPLYYHHTKDTFLFGSEQRQLFQHPSVSTKINEGMVAEHLACNPVNIEETLFQDVHRLPPAHSLVVDTHRLQIKRYWNPDPGLRIHYRRDENYLEHFLELLRQAVKCRLRCNGEVGATLSGGLDSPLVVGLAQTLLNEQEDKQRLKTFSITFPGREEDESSRIKQVADMWDIDSSSSPYTHSDGFSAWQQQIQDTLEPPDHPVMPAYAKLQIAAASKGVRVLLSGAGADAAFGGSQFPYYALLRDLKLNQMLGELRYQADHKSWKYALLRSIKNLSWPALPQAIRHKLELARPKQLHAPFLQQDFISAADLQHRSSKYLCAHQFSDLAQWQNHCTQSDAETIRLNEIDDRSDGSHGIEQRHPFYDRRLLEFSLAIPNFQHRRKDHGKLLLHAASQTFLPPDLRTQHNDGDFTYCVVQALMSDAVADTLHSLSIAQAGWVSQKKIIDVYNQLFNHYKRNDQEISYEYYRWLRPLWASFSIEMWYQHVKEI